MDVDALRAIGRTYSRPKAPAVADWADSLREAFDARYARANDLRDDIRTGKRNAYGQTADSIIRGTKHVGVRAAFQCPTCRTIHSRVGQCDDCRHAYGPA